MTDDEDIVLTDAEIYTEVVKLMLLPSDRIPVPQSFVYKSHRELGEGEVPTKSADVFAFASTCYAVSKRLQMLRIAVTGSDRLLRVEHHFPKLPTHVNAF